MQAELLPVDGLLKVRAAEFVVPSSQMNSVSNVSFPDVELGSVLESSGVNASKYAGDEKAQLAYAAKHLESMFVQQIFKSMRSVGQALASDDNPLSNQADGQFNALLDEQMAIDIVSSSSFGIAEAIYKQMV